VLRPKKASVLPYNCDFADASDSKVAQCYVGTTFIKVVCTMSAPDFSKLNHLNPLDSVDGVALGPVVGPTSHLTLHYRLSFADGGEDVMNTFNARPATLQLGIGQLAEFLENKLLGLTEGCHEVFDLGPSEGFGQRNPELLQRVSRAMLEANSEEREFQAGDLIDFPSPDGGRFAGVLKEIDAETALFDFNHPLAGRALRFEVKLLGVL
jgi:FKBP-type peptidyl-prolyl cis-trans isomerase SlpA